MPDQITHYTSIDEPKEPYVHLFFSAFNGNVALFGHEFPGATSVVRLDRPWRTVADEMLASGKWNVKWASTESMYLRRKAIA